MVQIYLFYFEYDAFFFNFVANFMRRLKKNIFLGSFGLMVGTLALVRTCHPEVVDRQPEMALLGDSIPLAEKPDTIAAPASGTLHRAMQSQQRIEKPEPRPTAPKGKPEEEKDSFVYHPIKSVPSFSRAFPDLQDVQIVAAKQWGVPPIADRTEAEQRKDELVYVGANPYFDIDSRMNRSIPYLVPRAGVLLQRIGRSFMDSLCVKGLPMHKIIVTSVLRTEADIKKLRRHNVNATEQSCHRFGTTFDIAYSRYNLVTSPAEPDRRAVRDDTLKWVLSEVLRDFREQGNCYIKYERKQGCFHITVR